MMQMYDYSLVAALSLLLFFAVYFLVAKTPDKPIFAVYVRSRRIMGLALLVLACNYIVHLFVGVRFLNHTAAILLNISTYFLAYWLFSSAFIILLDRGYLTARRVVFHMLLWLLYLGATVATLFLTDPVQTASVTILATLLVAYGVWLSLRLIRTYRRAVRLFDDTHSDNIASYIRWMSILTWWALIYGVGCSLLTFLPDRYVFVWILSSIAFYIYIFVSYTNYMLYYDRVEHILETSGEYDELSENSQEIVPSYYADIRKRLDKWIEEQGYTKPGLTLEELAGILDTNRTYLSSSIRTAYGVSFREWITGLRLECAKRMLQEHPEYTVAAVSESTGFASLSYFTKIFREKEGQTPGKWIRSVR